MKTEFLSKTLVMKSLARRERRRVSVSLKEIIMHELKEVLFRTRYEKTYEKSNTGADGEAINLNLFIPND